MAKNIKQDNKLNETTKIKAPIVDALKTAYENPTYQFHIPGHTKGKAIFKDFRKLIGEKALNIDTTDEFDNLGTLHPATGREQQKREPIRAEKTVGRNDPCPCGSGKKYKNCHGQNA